MQRSLLGTESSGIETHLDCQRHSRERIIKRKLAFPLQLPARLPLPPALPPHPRSSVHPLVLNFRARPRIFNSPIHPKQHLRKKRRIGVLNELRVEVVRV